MENAANVERQRVTLCLAILPKSENKTFKPLNFSCRKMYMFLSVNTCMNLKAVSTYARFDRSFWLQPFLIGEKVTS